MAAKKEIEENTELKTVHEPQAFTGGGAAGFPPCRDARRKRALEITA